VGDGEGEKRARIAALLGVSEEILAMLESAFAAGRGFALPQQMLRNSPSVQRDAPRLSDIQMTFARRQRRAAVVDLRRLGHDNSQ